jgi:pimeloyl-ACP methyl ester carboxylesterase
MEQTIVVAGRELRVALYGDPAGFPVLVHNGTPNSRLVFEPHVTTAAASGIRLISYDRPGYGGSTPRPGRRVADAAEDVRALAEALGVERLGLWSFSGGGPFTLASAALLVNLVAGAVVLASPAPGYEDASSAPPDEQLAHLLGMTAEEWRSNLPARYAPFADYAVATLRIALGPGAEGWKEDNEAFASPWGFDLESIGVPVRLRHGRVDTSVSVENSEWLAARISGVDFELTDDDHLGLFFRNPEEDYCWLAALA